MAKQKSGSLECLLSPNFAGSRKLSTDPDERTISPLNLSPRTRRRKMYPVKTRMNTPLHHPKNSKNLRELLYDENCRNLVNYKNHEGNAPIHSIIERFGPKERLECLLTLFVHSDCDVNLKTIAGMSAMHLAAKVGDEQSVKALIVFGADVNTRNSKLETPLDLAKQRKWHKLILLFQDLGALTGDRLPVVHTYPNLLERNDSTSSSITGENEASLQPAAGSRILCLDGGGMRGLVQIEVLTQIEKLTGKKITELFDWIIGTSTGGVLALGLVYAKKTLPQLRQLYFNLKERVFDSPGPFGIPSYDSAELEKFCQEELGTQMTMASVSHPRVLIAAVYKKILPLKIHFFNNCFGDMFSTQPVWKVARYTSACPGYFTEFENYVDGGVLANNPSEHGLTRIHQFYADQGEELNISSMVSVGTGIFPDREVGNTDLTSLLLGSPLNMVENAKNMVDLLTHALAESELAAENCKSRCMGQGIPFYRFNPQLPEVIALGESDNVKLLEMILQARQQAACDTQIGMLVQQWNRKSD